MQVSLYYTGPNNNFPLFIPLEIQEVKRLNINPWIILSTGILYLYNMNNK